MTSEVFFFSKHHRELILKDYCFNLKHARSELLNQFSDDFIEQRASEIAQDWVTAERLKLTSAEAGFDEKHTDSFEQQVIAARRLLNIREKTRLDVLSGLYFGWEKSLRQTIPICLQHPDYRDLRELKAFQKANSQRLIQILTCLGWDIDTALLQKLGEFHLIINVHKHGDGDAHRKLYTSNPKYYEQRLLPMYARAQAGSAHAIGVTPDDFEVLTSAIKQFWLTIPESLFYSETKPPMPDWLIKALNTN